MIPYLIWVAVGVLSLVYLNLRTWWEGDNISLQDVIICMLLAPTMGGFLTLAVLLDLADCTAKALKPFCKWFTKDKAIVLIEGRKK